MKKLTALVLAMLCILSLFGCGKGLDNTPTVTGFIQEIHDGSILITTSSADGNPYGANCVISVNIRNCADIYQPLAIGDEIIVYYDGNIAESYPLQISRVYAIQLKAEAVVGNLRTYHKNTDGTWKFGGYTYKYRLECKGSMPNSDASATFVYLSNTGRISFEKAWKAAGFSSNTKDYFAVEDAVLVDFIVTEM